MSENVIGLDIGGANLKAANANGSACLWPFELWKHPETLADMLRELCDAFPDPIDRFAVTMTGELCDCFFTKRQGVTHILNAVETVADGRRVDVWTTDGVFVDLVAAHASPKKVAASNWHALATFVAQHIAANAILIDVGSTTTDVIPIENRTVTATGRTDEERLVSKELVYTGVSRTPICAIMGRDVMAELFATSLDAYLVLADAEEDATDTGTADGRPATRVFARARLARMLGGDIETIDEERTRLLAVSVAVRQRAMIVEALHTVFRRMTQQPDSVIISGSGEFLAQAAWVDFSAERDRETTDGVELISLGERLGPELSQTACAYALAVLGGER